MRDAGHHQPGRDRRRGARARGRTRGRVEDLAREAIRDIGYEQDGFHWQTAKVDVLLHAQSADIAQGVDAAGNKDEGAGDQGIMFGYACRETPELMPAPIFYAHRILKLMSEARQSGDAAELGPDAKSQVTVQYDDGKPVGVHLDRRLDPACRGAERPSITSDDVARWSSRSSARPSPRTGSTPRPSGTSTRPASS